MASHRAGLPIVPDYAADREYQQDQVVLLSHQRFNGCVLSVLADGMGGAAAGAKRLTKS